jgi:tetratricopeptide (TPR) repeat protein
MKKILPLLVFVPLSFTAQTPDAAFKKLMDAGDAKYAVKGYKDAYKEYDEALKLISVDLDKLVSAKSQIAKDHAEWLKCLNRHARCAYFTSNTTQANLDADKLLAVDSVNADAKALRAYVKHKSGDKMNACREFKIQQRSGSEVAGKIYEDCFCWGEGVTQFREASSAFSLSRNNEALTSINNALDILPDSINYHVKKGEICLKMENFENAHSLFSYAINKEPAHFKGWYLRGITNLKMGKADSAFKDLSECIKINSYNLEAYRKRAEICEAQEQWQSAIYDYQQCLRLKNDAEFHFKIAMIKLEKIEDELGACEEFKKAAAMGYEEAQTYVTDCNNPKKKKK